MNMLTLFIYLASIATPIGVFLGTVSLIILAYLAIWTAGVAMHNDSSYGHDKAEYPNYRFFLPIAFALGLLATFIPSTETVYLMAGSELGEYTVQSEAGQEILNSVKEIIQIQLQELKEPNDNDN